MQICNACCASNELAINNFVETQFSKKFFYTKLEVPAYCRVNRTKLPHIGFGPFKNNFNWRAPSWPFVGNSSWKFAYRFDVEKSKMTATSLHALAQSVPLATQRWIFVDTMWYVHRSIEKSKNDVQNSRLRLKIDELKSAAVQFDIKIYSSWLQW